MGGAALNGAEPRVVWGLEAGAGAVRALMERKCRVAGLGGGGTGGDGAKVPVVGISGRQGAGKSTLARLVAGGGGLVLSTDDYAPDYAGLEAGEIDLPEHADLARLVTDVAALRRGEARAVPVWSFMEHRRVGERVVRGGEVVVVEGLHALNAALAGVVDVGVLVRAGAGVRLVRVLARETGERGWTLERAAQHMSEVADATFARFEGEYEGRADVVVVNEEAGGGPGAG